jgi:phosphoribosylanthranilate isomerase
MIAEIAALAPPPVATVLLTAETKADAISAHVRATNPTAVQIVAHIEPTESARLARLEPHVRRIQAISPHIHAFLLDSGRPGEKIPVLGGTGRTHNWAVSSRFVQESTRPVFLAGGLTAENVGDAIRQVRPFGLDLCSGVRTSGQLDAAKLATFMTAVRRAEWAQTSIRA